MILFSRLGVAEISRPWPFKYPVLVKMSISIASSPRLSGTGMTYHKLRFIFLTFEIFCLFFSTYPSLR